MRYRYYTPEECVGLVGHEVVGLSGRRYMVETVVVKKDLCRIQLRDIDDPTDSFNVHTRRLCRCYRHPIDGSPCGVEVSDD